MSGDVIDNPCTACGNNVAAENGDGRCSLCMEREWTRDDFRDRAAVSGASADGGAPGGSARESGDQQETDETGRPDASPVEPAPGPGDSEEIDEAEELHEADPDPPPPPEPATGTREVDGRAKDGGALRVFDIEEIAARVERAGPREWLIEGLWPAGTYGILGAEDKAGKTWALLDLAVSVVTGTQWLGRFPCPAGNVVLFLGEGDEAAMYRRLSAIVADRGGGLTDLHGLRVCFTVPRLKVQGHLEAVRSELEGHPARLVGLDPFYLSAIGAKGADLYDMGSVLYGIQQVCQEAGSALVATHHWNQTGEGTGWQRLSGAGPSAWGRVLGSAAVERRKTEDDGTSDVLLAWEFAGSEISNQAFRVRRRVKADDQGDLGSSLQYSVEVTDEGSPATTDQWSPSKRRVLAALEGTVEGDGLTVTRIGDRVAGDDRGRPLKERTIQTALKDLAAAGLVDGDEPGPGLARQWWRLAG